MPPSARSPGALSYAGAAIVAIILAASFVYISGMKLNVDETFHYPQIARFLQHDFRLSTSITTLPGYHYAVFIVASMFGVASVVAIRFISFCIALLSIAAFHLLARQLRERDADEKTFQYVFFPLLYPFFFVIYTDVTSLLLIFLGILLTRRQKYLLAGLAGLISCLVRQDNVVWAGLLFLLMADDVVRSMGGLAWSDAGTRRHRLARVTRAVAANGTLHIATFVLFFAFVAINRGVAIGDEEMHPASALNLGNIWCLLFEFFFMFLPMNIANAAKIARLVRRQRLAVFYMASAFVFFMATFRIDHPYNTEPWAQWFLSNRILTFFQQNLLLEALFFVPILYSVLSLLCTRLYARPYYLIYPLSIVFLLPHWHVDPRYHLVPLLLFLAFKEGDNPVVTWITCLMYVALSGYFFESIVTYEFFF